MSARLRNIRRNGKKTTRKNKNLRTTPFFANIQNNGKEIKSLYKSSRTIQKQKIVGAKRGLIKALAEIAKNILNQALPLSTTQHRQLEPYAERLRALVCPKTLLRDKRQVLQTGGFLGFLLKPLLSLGKTILGPLLGNLQ